MRKGMRYEVWGMGCKLSAISYQLSAFRNLFLCAVKRLFTSLNSLFTTYCSLLTFHVSPLTVLFLASYLMPHASSAQNVSATLDREKILLGEQVTLELKAENINAQVSPVISWFSFPDTINHIEVVKRLPVDTVSMNGTTSYIQSLTLTSFDSGDWKLPPLYAVLQRDDGGRKDTLRTNEITLEVLPVDVSNLQQYHPMKDIIDVDVQPDYLLMAGIVSGILIVSAVIWFLLKKKKTKPSLQPVAAQSLFETAMSQLDRLRKENPPAQAFYNRLDDICRIFIQSQLHVRAMQLTSDELMIQLNVYIQPEARVSFYQLLRLISAVKFAKYQPAEEQKEADIKTAKEAVEHIYYNLQRNLTRHAH